MLVSVVLPGTTTLGRAVAVGVGRDKLAEAEAPAATAAVVVQCTLVTIVCTIYTIAATTAVFFSQGENRHEHEGS